MGCFVTRELPITWLTADMVFCQNELPIACANNNTCAWINSQPISLTPIQPILIPNPNQWSRSGLCRSTQTGKPNRQGTEGWRVCSRATHLQEGLAPDPRSDLQDGAGASLQQAHVAGQDPAVYSGARLQKERKGRKRRKGEEKNVRMLHIMYIKHPKIHFFHKVKIIKHQ